ncbi:ribosomal protection-like ABC-F family protein [Vagococcus sp.]|uniref:ribosomal protection-like ABC-F family protein n=1 Tax=Vagococcus sp. TaxID=1933889 RepID=UPI003F977416
MSIIKIDHLTFTHDGSTEPLFQDVSLNLDANWKLGLVGRNGRGKTTFLSLLQKKHEFSGTIETQLPFSYFPQHVENIDSLTYLLIDELTTVDQWQVERELTLLGTSLDCLWRPFSSLSGGEQTKVLLALQFANPDCFPLIDEPTNHLDHKGRQQVASYLQNKKQGFIVISHDQHFIDQTVDHILALDKAKIVLYQGNYATFLEQKEIEDLTEEQENEKLKKEIDRLKQTARKKAEWAGNREKDKYGDSKVKNSGAVGDTGFIGARAARVMKKSKQLNERMNQQISDKEKLLKNQETISPLTMNVITDNHPIVLTLENVTLSYDGVPLFKPISFQLNRGDRVAITGENGIGKSSLIDAIKGSFEGTISGEIIVYSQKKWSFLQQKFETLNHGSLQDFCETHQLSLEDCLNNLRKLGIERHVFEQPIENMSMGQQKKVELVKSLITPSHFYIWDEPLNYLDLYNHEQIMTTILNDAPTLLFIEHDQTFIEQVATKTIELLPYQ